MVDWEMRRLRFLGVWAVVILTSTLASATDISSMSCGTEIVVLGDSQNDVLQKCGEPSYTLSDSWVYETGLDSSKRTVVIHFGGDDVFAPKVVRIEEVSGTGSGDQP
jgi:hypothetical protein